MTTPDGIRHGIEPDAVVVVGCLCGLTFHVPITGSADGAVEQATALWEAHVLSLYEQQPREDQK